jgi:salicylate hydroxylase
MLPYLAQGANSSLEDGAVLGRLLGHVRHSADVPHAIKLYEYLRKERSRTIALETFKQVGSSVHVSSHRAILC